MRRISGALACATLVSAALWPAPATTAPSETTAVVAFIDSGINPYHEVFRDPSPRAYRHPSTYIPGFPKEAEALRLSLDEKNYMKAVHKDCEVWARVGQKKLYWFPGTKIVGAMALDSSAAVDCPSESLPMNRILDTAGHGTMVASRAAGEGYGACPECRIVAIQGTDIAGVKWAAKNAHWIDAQSNSWGPFLPGWLPADGIGGLIFNSPSFVRAAESAAQMHLTFWATGNGAATRFGLVGHPTIVDPRLTPSVVMAGGHDSGYLNLWPDFPPHVVADSCNSWAAYHNGMRGSADTVGGGTSAASPYAAGSAARLLLEARRLLGDTSTGVERNVVARGRAGAISKGPLEDGKLTLAEWKELLFKTATPRPKGQKTDGPTCDAVSGLVLYSSTPVRWQDVPEGYPEFLHIGYGAVDDVSRELAFRVLAGTADLPDRSTTDAYFEADGTVRGALHDFFSGP